MGSPATIINVDDNEPGRYAKRRILLRAGFSVHDASCGYDALAAIQQHAPDLVLLDVNLPDVDGIEVCRQIKSAPGGTAVIVLQISASAVAAPQAAAALDNGADAYLTEPVDPAVLVATISALLRLRKAERELSHANELLKRLNLNLERSNEDLQQFAFMASHDLQEPLRTVSLFAGLLQRSAAAKLDSSELEYLKHISDGSSRMRDLIDDLLSYSKAGQRLASTQPIDLNQVLSWAVDNLQSGISKSQAQITSDPLPTVLGEEAQLCQLFQNLIGNSIKYARPGVDPAIHISASRKGDQWVICIRDNGLGIESVHHAVIFGAFKRLHGREIPGTGIGLAICRRVVEAHGGQIWVESTLGEGSSFCFTLQPESAGGLGL